MQNHLLALLFVHKFWYLVFAISVAIANIFHCSFT